MLCRAKPYTGTEPYLFFSYCHKNADQVYPIIEQMAMDGYRIWYDDGIHPGDDWLEVIAEYLTRSTGCITAITPESTASHNCRSEINLCMELNKPIVSVLLKDFELSLATRLQLGATQYVRKYDYANDKAFFEKLYSAPVLSECRGAPVKLKNGIAEQLQQQAEEAREHKEQEKKEQIRKILEEHDRFTAQQEIPATDVALAQEKKLEELKRKVEEERKAEESRKKAEEAAPLAREKELEELKRKVKEEENRKAEDARRKAEEAARLAREKELEELQHKVEEEKRRKAEDARRKAEEAARLAQERELDVLRNKLRELLAQNNIEKPPETERKSPGWETGDITVALQEDTHPAVAKYEDSELTIIDPLDSECTIVEKNDSERTIAEKKTRPAVLVHLESSTFYPIRSAETSIGRSSVSCDIVFPNDHGMSRHHADIIHLHGKSYLRDMKSENGTFFNDMRLEAGASVPLESTSWIQLHDVRLLYLADALATYVCKEKRISLLRNKKTNACIYLTKEDLVLRRAKTSGRGCFTDDPKISREKHALVSVRNDHVYIKDLQSTNGTYIDERKIESLTDHPLSNGADLRIGDTILHCVDLQLKEGDN